MTGLEKILQTIDEDAQKKADAVIAQADLKAEEIMAAAKQEADSKRNEIISKSETDINAVMKRAESAAALLEKKVILEAKQQIISNIIDSARKSLAELPESEYINVILRMVEKFAHNKPGEILFSKSDIKRLPKDFEDRLKQTLSGKNAAALTVSKETAILNGGFLLRYGDIEENCSFDALFSAARENLQDEVNTLLFE